MDTTLASEITPVTIPAYGFFAAETLWTCAGVAGVGLCRDRHEAHQRAQLILAGLAPSTQAPEGQANEAEMGAASAWLDGHGLRDGGLCAQAVAAALVAGIHTLEWARASRYICAGWVPYAIVDGRALFLGRE